MYASFFCWCFAGGYCVLYVTWKSFVEGCNRDLHCCVVCGRYYEATVDEILEDGTCTVTFSDYNHTEVTQVTCVVCCLVHTDTDTSQ